MDVKSENNYLNMICTLLSFMKKQIILDFFIALFVLMMPSLIVFTSLIEIDKNKKS